MEDQLDWLERQIEGLVEGPLSRILGAEALASAVSGRMTRALTESLHVESSGRVYAPDCYRITLHPESLRALQQKAPQFITDLENGLVRLIRAGGYLLAQEPHIELEADPSLGSGEVRVMAWHGGGPLAATQVLRRPAGLDPDVPREAVLIIGSSRRVRLQRDGINIGRRKDNDIVLDAPGVSGLHAQLRLREGKYLLVDRGSKAGTYVDGKSVHEHVLSHGDVISIVGIVLEYREDPPPARPASSGDTSPMRQSSGLGIKNLSSETSGEGP